MTRQILLMGGPYDDVVIDADDNDDTQQWHGFEDPVSNLFGETEDPDAKPVLAVGAYVQAGITDNGKLAFLFHEPHAGCPRYRVGNLQADD